MKFFQHRGGIPPDLPVTFHTFLSLLQTYFIFSIALSKILGLWGMPFEADVYSEIFPVGNFQLALKMKKKSESSSREALSKEWTS